MTYMIFEYLLCAYLHQYIFFMFESFAQFLWVVIYLFSERIYSGYKYFISYADYKYFLPVCGLLSLVLMSFKN